MRWDQLTVKRRTYAWLVHLYTMSGGVLGMLALFAAANDQTRLAFLLLIISMIIDATDGLLARAANVSEVLPSFSGAQMDNAIDVLTFIFVPIFIIAYQELLPSRYWTIIPIIAGFYAYGQVDMKTEDNFFRGFPSYWNIIALYLFWLRPGPVVAVLTVTVPAVLTFIPTRYLYPSRNSIYWQISWTLGAIWIGMLFYFLFQAEPPRLLILISLYYPAYYMIFSFYIDWKIRRAGKRALIT